MKFITFSSGEKYFVLCMCLMLVMDKYAITHPIPTINPCYPSTLLIHSAIFYIWFLAAESCAANAVRMFQVTFN